MKKYSPFLFKSFRTMVKFLNAIDFTTTGFFGLDRKLGKFFMPHFKSYVHSKIQQPTSTKNLTHPFGINIFRCVHKEAKGGVEIGANAVVDALKALGIPYAICPVTSYLSVPFKLQFDRKSVPYGINLFQMTPDQTAFLYHLLGKSFMEERYNIAYWFWELENIPLRWRGVMNCLDEIWTSSEFTKKSFSVKPSLPVYVLPPFVTSAPIPASRDEFQLPKDHFIFLNLFDFRSYFERKNPLGVIQAFKQAFKPTEPVSLVIKCHSSIRFPHHMKILREEASGFNVHIIEKDLGPDGGKKFLSLSDAYISLHRSEGFGFPQAEAFLLEKPVITTAYSSTMEFTTPENSYLVEYQKTPILRSVGPYFQGAIWAEPSIQHAIKLLRYVYEHPDEAKEKARRGAATVRLQYSPEKSGALLEQRLSAIKKKYHENLPRF